MGNPIDPRLSTYTGGLNLSQHAIELAAREIATGRDHRSDPPSVVDVLGWVSIQQDQT